MPANPNLLPVSANQVDREAAETFGSAWRMNAAGKFGLSNLLAKHRLAAEQSKTAALVAMLEGMKRDSLPGCNAVIDEAIANAKALGEGVGS